MGKEKTRICCNCRHCIRVKDNDGMVKHNECEIDGKYLGYLDTMEGWCRRWCEDGVKTTLGTKKRKINE